MVGTDNLLGVGLMLHTVTNREFDLVLLTGIDDRLTFYGSAGHGLFTPDVFARVSGNDGCNNFFGSYTLDEDSLKFGLLGMSLN